MTKTKFLQNLLQTNPEDSKKWKMADKGLNGLAVGFFSGLVMLALFPSQAAHITNMVQIGMTAWGGIVGIYLGAQGTVEYKATSALQTSQEDHAVAPIVEEGKNAPPKKPWSTIATDEH